MKQESAVAPRFRLRRVPSQLRHFAREKIRNGDVSGLLGLMDNMETLHFVIENIVVLRERGWYEEALVNAIELLCEDAPQPVIEWHATHNAEYSLDMTRKFP